MIYSAMHLAKRELQQLTNTPAVWAGALCAGVILGLIGPFRTDEVMPLLGRLAYWCTTAVASFAIGSVASVWAQALGHQFRLRQWSRVALGTALATPLIVALVWLLDFALFGSHRDSDQMLSLVLHVFAICGVLNITLAYVAQQTPGDAEMESPAVLSRLAPPLRGTLVSISAFDHYVEVTTTKGKDMLLLRLRDAIRETAPVHGIRLHRSHWVATAQITRLYRRDGKAFVQLKDGRDLPFSRTYLPALKQAGF